MRVSELAKELGVDSKTVIAYLESKGIGGYKAANKIEGYHEELVRDHFPAAKKEEPEPARPKAILRRGNRERSFIPSDERPAEQPEEAKQPEKPAEEAVEEKVEEIPAVPAEEVTPETSEEPSVEPEAAEEPEETPEEADEKIVSVEEEIRKIAAEHQEEEEEIPESERKPQHKKEEEEKVEDDDDDYSNDFRNKNKKRKVVIPENDAPVAQNNNMQQRHGGKKKNVSRGGGDDAVHLVVTGKLRGADISQFFGDDSGSSYGGGYQDFKKKKKDKKKAKQQPVVAPNPTKAIKKILKIEDSIQIAELARRMGVKAAQLLSKLMAMGEMFGINDKIPYDTAQFLAEEFGFTAENVALSEESFIEVYESKPENMVPRPPVVTVMGHVDHGKTKLLDAIRHTNVVDREAGGITQHIGAYSVEINGGKITFLDTPGHEAFTAMRSRGAQATDVVILIVAADDGVMPQTVEAINHAKAANVPIIVAINKIDKPTANPAKVKNELLKYEIVAEELGGENLFVEISAKQMTNIEGLLEAVLLQVEMMDLKADPTKPAEGIVIESRMDLGKGPVATVLVKDGTLKIGDMVVTGASIGFVRSMMDWTGKRVKEASPSMAVEITGLDTVPPAGEKLYVFKDERKAKGLVELRINKQREKKNVEKATQSIEQFFAADADREEVKDLNVIVKGDVDGSVEAIIASLNKIEHKKMKIKVIHSGVGGINENDVLLASASQGLIIGFNVRVDNKAKQLAAAEGVSIQIFSIIYELIDAIKAAMSGMLAPIIKEEFIGKLEVREIFKVGKVGTIAGCMVTEGRVVRMSKIKLVRDNVVIYSGKLGTLKRFKDDVKEVKSGYECGATIDSYNDIKVGDVIECYIDKEFRDEVL
ncbi:translation initiation factor IF-2 [bacterium]|jgi:translation initiation factor IF-2|nr:translation initiation factor IF-2 [bacterium]MBP5591419.1 translation initiation factor IF-2 [bacterium]